MIKRNGKYTILFSYNLAIKLMLMQTRNLAGSRAAPHHNATAQRNKALCSLYLCREKWQTKTF